MIELISVFRLNRTHVLVKQYGDGRWIVTLSVAFAVQKEIKSIPFEAM